MMEDHAAITNLTTANINLTEQVAFYANCLSTKEVDNMLPQISTRNLQGEFKNLKAEVSRLKKSGHSGGASAADKDNVIMLIKWEREGQFHHTIWWSTT